MDQFVPAGSPAVVTYTRRGRVWGAMVDGSSQGDPMSEAFAAIGLQPALEELDTAYRAGGGMARAGADDVEAQGRLEVVFPAVLQFEERLATWGAKICWDKSWLYLREGNLPTDAPPFLALAGEQIGHNFLRGMIMYGEPLVGSDKYKTIKIRQIKEEILIDSKRRVEVPATERQGLRSALRLSIQQRFQ